MATIFVEWLLFRSQSETSFIDLHVKLFPAKQQTQTQVPKVPNINSLFQAKTQNIL
jgi:hypothetical protein